MRVILAAPIDGHWFHVDADEAGEGLRRVYITTQRACSLGAVESELGATSLAAVRAALTRAESERDAARAGVRRAENERDVARAEQRNKVRSEPNGGRASNDVNP